MLNPCSSFVAKRPSHKPLRWLGFLLLLLFLVGCLPTGANWPGVTQVGDRVYIAYEARVYAVDVPARRQLWSYAGESGNVQFFAPPFVSEEEIVLGDYGTAQSFLSTGLTTSVYRLNNEGDNAPTIDWVISDRNQGISGRVFGQPLVADGLVFVVTSDNHIVAMERATGRKVWDYETGNAIWGGPVYREGVLYVSATDRSVYALESATGELIWQRLLTGMIADSPHLGEEHLFVTSFDGRLYALDLADGSVVWDTPTNEIIWAAPVAVPSPTDAHEIIYLATLGGGVYGVDGRTGTVLWQKLLPLEGGSVEVRPLFFDNQVFVAVTNADKEAGALYALAYDSGEELWRVDVPGPVNSRITAVNDTIIVVTTTVANPLVLLQYAPTNGELLWTLPLTN